ncbi:phospholipid scramblase-related protein [Tuwongella immobilis]|uniref:Uncharacterized protein n=1 Tax=Tuwongella immobilis TaxID=692036 RepID=A0A6C2YUB9_9BACT|nr:phospholipid scramblase-related protein [Tuwongella immobilis]VIP04462.1 Scramblase family protein OS=Planctomyces limnophilus (strain ATCC 43296 / DSM 3776 / IFAM 1008 / 290) GN=Plim_3844 PE=4 SV=1: Scramblase [Tuwongella immobilis]VTS06286.1 Scramblase family protein OS=Planctomyces limnophilus (strain ATCC 43296 / DSM 3776 / IFAM 1008 / 290) GN=Plim_3844 PE=4 SV=1: Scramblase [Tuwongella immobilis]
MLERLKFLVRERVAWLKTVDQFDIFDPDTQEQIGIAEEKVSGFVQAIRYIISKKLTPSRFEIRELPDNSLVFEMRRNVGFLKFRVDVFDAQGEKIGYFMSKVFSLGGGFHVYTADGTKFAEVKGGFTGWHFKFLATDGQQIGEVSKKYEGIAKELFTSADTYLVSISEELAEQPLAKMLLLATSIAIDTVYKEQ